MEATIAAIATALGEGGVGIVRISGKDAAEVVSRVFFPHTENKNIRELPGYSVHYGHVMLNDKIIDEALLVMMKAPHSYTGEDVAELQCHGGVISVKKVLQVVLQNGARLAEPGEFTKRAFLNGRLDLSQAEAVIEIIRAKTNQAMALAVSRLNGKLKEQVIKVRKTILSIIAHLEAMIDFEDEVEALSYENLLLLTQDVYNDVKLLLKKSGQGKIYQDGVKVAIIGKPNVGKSSLLNALIGENKAIVTHIPGTTRDVIEEWLNIEGIPVRIIDTAGIRQAEDIIEKIGIEKTLQTMKEADIILFIVDVETGITLNDYQILASITSENTIILVNKADLSAEKATKVVSELKNYDVLAISAKEESGLQELAEMLKIKLVGGNFNLSEESAVGNVRHLDAIERVKNHLEDVLTGIEQKYPFDFLTIDLRASWEILGEITGDTVGEDIIEHIFANFCIGK